jgi:hypothetical protein
VQAGALPAMKQMDGFKVVLSGVHRRRQHCRRVTIHEPDGGPDYDGKADALDQEKISGR